ncbi:MAG: thioredoxin-like domain-containing protein [Gemmataceae bacterium]|nr:thioredoxin-like domain-containing protein [Gemmata sp.]MDW8198429.1 thioredoxin-like domain-containing protein [Gemmataceae bacterium]
MSDAPPPVLSTRRQPLASVRLGWAVVLALAAGAALVAVAATRRSQETPTDPPAPPAATPAPAVMNPLWPTATSPEPREKRKIAAPELTGGVAWLNSAAPLWIHDSFNPLVERPSLRGKIVLLDFWTLCCINCIHNLPDLAKLHKKYANQLVVIGVHSPKFDSEKSTASIRKAILRYQIDHPVVNDANHALWDKYECDAWPTLVLIDPEGNLYGYTTGEGNYELLDIVIGRLVEEHRQKKTLNETPLRFDLAKYRETATPLYFPGKVLADAKGKRLFIADSTHHRLVVTDLTGKQQAVIGTGLPGKKDGKFDEAQFDDPQGMALRDNILYVADRKNHSIRAVDLSAKTVTTVAGTGRQGEPEERRLNRPIPAKEIGLNSPWDLLIEGDKMYIALAGHHQIWVLDLKANTVMPYAGTGAETLRDGALRAACFAQPSGLASDGQRLFVADSETSSLRAVPLDPDARVQTLVGRGLFVFGDRDGPGRDGDEDSLTEARMQHALGVTYHDGKIYIADTYNNKIKVYDLATHKLTTLLNGRPFGIFGPMLLNEPAGLSYADGKLYIADTNSHRIVVWDINNRVFTPLKLTGVEPPRRPQEPINK